MTPKERAVIINTKLKKLFPKEIKAPLNHSNSWELLVAVILSAQTTDKQVNVVTQKLFTKYQTLNDYAKTSISQFEQDIRSIGLYKNKAKNIIAAAKIIRDEYNGRIPKPINKLIKIPGVGRKTANVILGHVHNRVEGIVIDTHVKRLTQKFGLTTARSPDTIEKDLMKLLPQEEWWGFANRIKLYGQIYSPARKKDDNDDPISQMLTDQEAD